MFQMVLTDCPGDEMNFKSSERSTEWVTRLPEDVSPLNSEDISLPLVRWKVVKEEHQIQSSL